MVKLLREAHKVPVAEDCQEARDQRSDDLCLRKQFGGTGGG
jgi:hypothetical protein